ncbi:hypothetical protein H0H92_016139 [Tricholoma furcatifolium]|nr:hypothetical protein H0H92_016139 [Tricholoma furcatifolium]
MSAPAVSLTSPSQLAMASDGEVNEPPMLPVNVAFVREILEGWTQAKLPHPQVQFHLGRPCATQLRSFDYQSPLG